MIGIRVDANETIASGHIMRCLSIARHLKDNCIFIVADDYARQLISSKGFEVFTLGTDYSDMESELDILKELISRLHIDVMLVDSYKVTPAYLSCLKTFCKVVYLDDIYAFPYDVNVLANYAAGACDATYKELFGDALLPDLYLGPAYAPLREEFLLFKSKDKGVVTDIFITSGATDKFDVVLNLVKQLVKLDDFSNMKLHVISGMFNQNADELKTLALQYFNVLVYENVSNMAEIMSKCQIAVSAGGSTLMELAAVGVPTIAYIVADNQVSGVKALVDMEAVMYAGNANCVDDANCVDCIHSIVGCMQSLISDKALRDSLREKASSLVDGLGAKRIAQILAELEKI
ncbi:MAG: UDP-2,4-diacetamido-2,4,6-trideoxy-beta-L-altropyranose hydrolase [Lachnospiraceae bacterium]|nr:UDP-2,4-diacetamido-2,4,6-trideoxy-beta-L-altropyranose hydrolase [Lachnospiraceae bacterium]